MPVIGKSSSAGRYMPEDQGKYRSVLAMGDVELKIVSLVDSLGKRKVRLVYVVDGGRQFFIAPPEFEDKLAQPTKWLEDALRKSLLGASIASNEFDVKQVEVIEQRKEHESVDLFDDEEELTETEAHVETSKEEIGASQTN